MKARLPVENGDTLKTLQDFLAKLLTSGEVDALLVPMRTPKGTITHALVKNPALLAHADPLAPILPVNSATLAGKVSIREPRPKVGVVMRSCELRALIELVKMKQAELDDLLLIAVDCPGAYPVPDYMTMISNNGTENAPGWEELFKTAETSPDTTVDRLRAACQMCEQPVYEKAAVRIELFGADRGGEVFLTVEDELAEKLALEAGEGGNRDEVVGKLVTARTAERDKAFAGIRERLEGDEELTGVFAACIRCHNCMTVCPMCYCKTCVFKSQLYDHEPMQYALWAGQKGAHRMPSDTTLFHLTRLNHMGLSCVGCGMCTEACPADLPVGLVFRAIGANVQAKFDYLPGENVDEPLPLVTFEADEWTEVGEG